MNLSEEALKKNSQCLIGALVSVPAKEWGVGVCISVSGKYMKIDFGGKYGVKEFQFPAPLLNGWVLLLEEDRIIKAIEARRSSMSMEERILEVIEDRKIDYFVHYTHMDHIGSILQNGICSVDYMNSHGIDYKRNDPQRLDGRPDAISVSVSFPNYRTFYKCFSETGDIEWCVFLLNPRKVITLDCAFFWTNAANRRCRAVEWTDLQGVDAFERMFDKTGRNPSIPNNYTTDPQAEIMVKEVIPPDFIEKIAFAYPVKVSGVMPCECIHDHKLFCRRQDYQDWSDRSTDVLPF